jgi:hypothetical protein
MSFNQYYLYPFLGEIGFEKIATYFANNLQLDLLLFNFIFRATNYQLKIAVNLTPIATLP